MSEANGRGAQPSLLGGWFSGSIDAVERERQAAEAAGREAYEYAIRTGEDVQARTRADLIALGRSKLARDAANAAHSTLQAAGDPNTWREGLMQADAAARAATNAATFGLADPIAAGLNTALGRGRGSLSERFDSNLRQEKLRDAYDAVHRGVAHQIGDVVGTGLSAFGGYGEARAWSNGLTNAAKGNLGEALSIGKSYLLGDPPARNAILGKLERSPIPLSTGRTTIPDHVRQSGKVVESKFGFSAGLTKNQRQARRELGQGYQVDYWTPNHVGFGAGAMSGAASAGASMSDDRDD